MIFRCVSFKITGDFLVILEYCCHGNLRDYIIQKSTTFINQLDQDGKYDSSIGANEIVQYENIISMNVTNYFDLKQQFLEGLPEISELYSRNCIQ